MDIGKNDAKLGSPILLTMVLLIIIPSSAGYIDCRISCRRCHENTEHPAVLEVYCAMCEECKQRRRERMLGKTKGKIKPTENPLVRMRVGAEVTTDNEALILRPQESLQFQQVEQDTQLQYQGQPQQQYEPQQQFEQQPVYQSQQPPQPPQPTQPPQEPPEPQQPQAAYKPQKALRGMVYPAGCPTPPICSDSEDETEAPNMPLTQPVTSTTTTTTTTTQAPCPPVHSCRKKKKHPPPPCMNPCMVPPPMCPCPMFPPQGPPMFPPINHPGNPQWPVTLPPPPMSPDMTPQTNGPIILDPASMKAITKAAMNEDYHYVYIGLPKKYK